MGRYEHPLPAILEPVGDICLQISIPAHPDYVALFIRAVRMLETNRLYVRDDALSAKIVVDQWRQRTITPMIEALASATGNCQDLDGECLTYPPFASFISYFPQNPYTEPDLIPDGFEQPPFFVNGKDNAHDLPNYLKGDVILDFGSINIEPSWDLAKTPRIELCLTGSGVVEIHLLKIVQGGAAVISLDNPVDLGDLIAGLIGDGIEIIQLNQDIISLPPETAEEVIIELDVETEGDHTIYIYYLPVVNDSLIPLFFGGGLREISLCGNIRPCGTPPPPPPPPLEGVSELKTEFRFTSECGLEYRYRNQEDEIISDWIPVQGWVDNAALCFSVQGGDNMATIEEICQAIECGVERVAARYLSGTVENLAGGDIVLTPGQAPVVVPPGQAPNDPTTDSDERARSGGVISIRQALTTMLTDLNSWYGADATADIAVGTAIFRMMGKYKISDESALTAGMTAYWTFLGGSGAKLTTWGASLDSWLYCKGYDSGSIVSYIISNINSNYHEFLINVINSFSDTQFSNWYNQGKVIPSTAYITYSCVPVATEEFTLDMSTGNFVQYTLINTQKALHRILFDVSGSFVDSDVPNVVCDFFYRVNTLTGAKTFNNALFQLQCGGMAEPSQAQVPYNDAHVYSVTLDHPASGFGGGGTMFVGRDNEDFTVPNVTGVLTCKVTDLGEYA